MFRSTRFAAVLALAAAAAFASAPTRAQTTAGTLTPNATPASAAAASGPAKGANSFTEGEAQSRIADSGFSDVAALQKDADGIWRGTAMKSGQQVHVWLDYKGNVGQQ